jgi:hypothetical protein
MSRVVLGMAMLFLALILIPVQGFSGTTIIIPDNYLTIQQGIDAAVPGDTVLVRDGTYLLDSPLDFYGKSIIVRSENGAKNCILDGQQATRIATFHSSEGSDAVLSGFTIRNGFSPNGSGIYIYAASPTISDCIISTNRAYLESGTVQGGGLYLESSAATIRNCTIIGNYALSAVYGSAQGGGIYTNGGAPVLTNIIVSGNTASAGTDAEGGGIYSSGSVLSINDSTIGTNSAINGYRYIRGGGLFFSKSTASMANCIIYGNSADLGGGIYFDGSSSFSYITNCTIVRNTAVTYGGSIYFKRTSARVINSILWENSPEEIRLEGTSSPIVTYSDVYGGYFGSGNIDADPLFANVEQQNFHLTSRSPALNTGTNSAQGLPNYDKDGSSRIINSVVDMGAYEYSSSQATDVIVYPQVAVGGGYQVVIIISNKSDSNWSGVGKPLKNDGTLDYLTTQITLGPKETKKYVLTGGSTTKACGFEIYGNSGSLNSAVSVNFFYNYIQDEQLKDSTGVPKSQLAKKFTFPIERTSTVDTGLSIRRRTNQPTTQVALTLIDANGNQLQQVYTGSDSSGFISSLFTTVPASFVGSVVAESPDDFYIVVIRMESTQTGFQLTSVQPEAN